MMVGEAHRFNPTVHVPPWSHLDEDQTDVVYSPINYNAVDNDFNGNGNSFYLQEAFSALQRYLPSNQPDVELDSEFPGPDGPDSPVDAYSCDHFRMFEFKVRKCARGRSHDWTECPYAHPGEKARRRDPRKYHYSGTACPDFRKGNCRKGETCELAHGVFECWLNPARYRTQPCKDGSGCRVCFFAHTPDQLRVVTSSSADSYDGSSPSCAKTMTFWSSPRSGSPSVSPRAESSPPVSPMAQSLSRSLGSASITEMLTSLRNLQLGKVKSFQVGCGSPSSPSGFGSPRSALIRPGFCSLPSTPTRNATLPGIGYLDTWDKVCEEEPVMERVESGRDLRAKMFEKLSKENSLERVNPGHSTGAPDLDWVSDLVN
ncbi:Zinc finger CCCH domain-containing protein 20 [Hibiscus syriacus]|uniref:Zinc finger CCCH domain-containing protein 20 n=1 Tax=Hibiscus syriacus TaxID=106335 RepID=A0A6A2Y5R0_HIBSY|nr:zinc finger CCCH domain-containing protein 49-like isoform X1 [Hibiscus syriacus]KAE8671446.1 Zinc finger CCCH domain-containing protein 20 [Hibiscus syriacus]